MIPGAWVGFVQTATTALQASTMNPPQHRGDPDRLGGFAIRYPKKNLRPAEAKTRNLHLTNG